MVFDELVFDAHPYDIGSAKRNPLADVIIPSWFSTAINQENGTNVNKLMQIICLRSMELFNAHTNLMQSMSIASAKGDALDAIADGYNITRREGESDDDFRTRIPSAIAIYSSSGTVPDIKKATAYMLGMDEDEITLVERYTTPVSKIFTVRICGKPDIMYDWSKVDEVINRIRPAGVKYESAEYNITSEWVGGATGYGYDPWGEQWPAE